MSEPLVPTGAGVIDPPPDPWSPPRANAAQAASIATGATGAGLLANATPNGSSLLMLPDPTEIFSRVAHVLGFQFDASSAWTWGLILVVLSVILNIYSYLERYLYARRVKPLWDEQVPRLEREAAQFRRLQAATPPAQAQGSGGGGAA